jgi:4-cresol dehydrogenase (hydroxylating)
MIDVPSPGWGSLIGNALDHGGGRTPLSDHFGAHCGMEVVLANGEVLRTGMGALPGAITWQQFKYGIGPHIDGIFSQSNYGVVTKMGFWLQPEPEVVRTLSVVAPRHDDAVPMVDIMSNLIYAGVIDAYVELISPVLNGPRNAELDGLRSRGNAATGAQWDRYAASRNLKFWRATFTFFGPEDLVDARMRHVQKRFSVIPDVEFAEGPDYRFPMSREQREQVVPPNKRILGIPSLDTFTGRTPENPEVADGHMDLFSVIPMTGEAVLEALKTIGHAFTQVGVEARPGIIASYHPRTFVLTSALPITRGDREANRRTRAAYERVVKLTAEHGWGPYRAHAAFGDLALSSYSFNDNALTRFHATLKDAVDPNGILSAGRYGIWPKSMRGSA